MTEPDNQPTAHGPPLDRRTFLRAAGAGAGAVVTGAGAEQMGYSPVEHAEADSGGISIKDAAIATGRATTVGAGITAYKTISEGSDASAGDSAGVLESDIFWHYVDIKNSMGSLLTEMQRLSNESDPQQTPFANSAWGNIRNAVGVSYNNGGTEADASQRALDALNEQFAVSIYNMLDLWNSFHQSIVSERVIEEDEGIQVLQGSGSQNPGTTPSGASLFSPDYFAAYGETTASGDYVAVEWDFDPVAQLPGDVTQMDRIPDDAQWREICLCSDSSNEAPASMLGASNVLDTPWGDRMSYIAAHPDHDNRDMVVGQLSNALYTLESAYDSIKSDLNQYVTAVYNALDSGKITPADLYSPQDLIDQFGDADEQARLSAELMAVGVPVPDGTGYEAKISHADLDADVWGWLYPQWSGDAGMVQAGMTIASADYEQAFFGWYGGANGEEWKETTLSGTTDLQILDVTGLDDEQHVEPGTEEAAANGEIVLGVGDSTPEPIRFPADHADYRIKITGDVTDTTHDVAEVETRDTDAGTEYYLPSTGLAQDETIVEIRVLPPVNYDKAFESPADVTTISDEDVKNQTEAAKAKREALNEWSDEGGGFLGGGSGFLSTGGRGMVGGVILAVLAIFTLSTLN